MNFYQVLKTIWVCIPYDVIIRYEYLIHILSLRCTNSMGYSCMYIDEACVRNIVIFMQDKELLIQIMDFVVGVMQGRKKNQPP